MHFTLNHREAFYLLSIHYFNTHTSFNPLNSEIAISKFEDTYLKVRAKELRLYPDEIIASLPIVPKTHPHFREWMIREMTFEKFKIYLQQKNKTLHILDLGCGTGWMSNKMSEINQSVVMGIDLNWHETEQAKRIFKNNQRLTFHAGDLLAERLFLTERFDIIVLAASIQYFPDINRLVRHLFRLLNPNGEIHIVDSPFYSENKIEKAKEASRNYYRNLGCEEMTRYYHHHCWSEIEDFHFQIMNRTWKNSFLLKIFGTKRNYFPWIVIYQS